MHRRRNLHERFVMAGVTFTANGAQHELRLGTRACRAIERDLGMSMPRFIGKMSGKKDKAGEVLEDGDLSFADLHLVFLHGLNGGKGAASPDEADDVIDGVGGMVAAAAILGDAIAEAFPAPPEDEKTEGGTAAGNGRKPKAT
ncbi:hypothetical protein [Jannaschia formosa]|uniref:hypothetical protein n=1 Tax=Jannaschia formosa TaxID=2259592 RepID=UPI001074F944|nr:hypothetical protein [Jannaschia formosa]TFL16438.1 hypothetical protein DR046_20165 [Jannaschia formosa]